MKKNLAQLRKSVDDNRHYNNYLCGLMTKNLATIAVAEGMAAKRAVSILVPQFPPLCGRELPVEIENEIVQFVGGQPHAVLPALTQHEIKIVKLVATLADKKRFREKHANLFEPVPRSGTESQRFAYDSTTGVFSPPTDEDDAEDIRYVPACGKYYVVPIWWIEMVLRRYVFEERPDVCLEERRPEDLNRYSIFSAAVVQSPFRQDFVAERCSQ